MLTVHHLNNSRSQRVLWLLEELGLPYELKAYNRDTVTNLAPPELKSVHPLGKSPVITDDGRTIIESGAITDYIIRRHGGGRRQPGCGRLDATHEHGLRSDCGIYRHWCPQWLVFSDRGQHLHGDRPDKWHALYIYRHSKQ
jgi:glutathione S-transferase